jgi:hypothetical protein
MIGEKGIVGGTLSPCVMGQTICPTNILLSGGQSSELLVDVAEGHVLYTFPEYTIIPVMTTLRPWYHHFV